MALIDEIRALPAELRAQRDTQQIADALPARETLIKTEIGKGTVLVILGLDIGNPFLDFVDSNPEFRHIKHLLEAGGLDMALPLVRGTLDALIGNAPGFAQEHADALKALAERSAPVDEFEVRKLCWSDDGQWLV